MERCSPLAFRLTQLSYNTYREKIERMEISGGGQFEIQVNDHPQTRSSRWWRKGAKEAR
jgi:hypothetical protein